MYLSYSTIVSVYAKPLVLPAHFRFVVAVYIEYMEAMIAVNIYDKKV